MMNGLRRYEFSERLAEILGESRRDLRFRVTLMVTGGLVPPGPRGRGSPVATPQYAANLLIGAMAAPQQAHTVEAIRCYQKLHPSASKANAGAPRVIIGAPDTRPKNKEPAAIPLLLGELRFGEALTRLLTLAQNTQTRHLLAQELFGVRISRSYPSAAIQLGVWSQGQRTLITRHYEPVERARSPAWLDPGRDGIADPGLLHTVFLPVSKLLEIGALTTHPDNRSPFMLNLGPKMASIANLANLARQTRYRRQWEKLLSALATVQAWADTVDKKESRLVEVTDFGSNPGNLRMLTYVPNQLPPAAPLVVILHGCTQTAASYDKGTGWSTLADRFGFALLLPQQHWTNNPLRCFNWFRPEDTARDSGEPLSIKQMIYRMIADYGIDRRRVYVTGLSSGGAMTSVMLATYPDVFAGGSVIAGVPYRSANGLQESFETIFQGRSRSEREWGDLVRAASPHQGPWPKVSVWHGDADSSVTPINADEIVKQWIDIHGLKLTPTVEGAIEGYPHRAWHNVEGDTLVESYTITGMTHGAPLDPGDADHQCGTAAPYFHDVGISSTYHIAKFWGLLDRGARPEVAASASVPEQEPPSSEPVYAARLPLPSELSPIVYVDSAGQAHADEAFSSKTSNAENDAKKTSGNKRQAGIDVQGIISQSLAAAGLLKGAQNGSADSNTPLGVDVHGIVSKSLEAAGLIKGAQSGSTNTGQRTNFPLGLDIQGIISKSLEAAGGLIDAQNQASEAESSPSDSFSRSGWSGAGWELLTNDPRRLHESPQLFGQAVSGSECKIGSQTRSVSRQLSLGHRPELSYIRKLELGAGVNPDTSARFSVLVDGVPVDEVSAIGMNHAEEEWLQRSGIDLTKFADRTVTLTFEVAAHSNLCKEVYAKAWVDQVTVHHASTAEEL